MLLLLIPPRKKLSFENDFFPFGNAIMFVVHIFITIEFTSGNLTYSGGG